MLYFALHMLPCTPFVFFFLCAPLYVISEIGYEDSPAIHEFTPTFYQQTVKDAYDSSVRGFGPFLTNHLDTMVQRGPDNIDGAKATSEVRKMSSTFC